MEKPIRGKTAKFEGSKKKPTRHVCDIPLSQEQAEYLIKNASSLRFEILVGNPCVLRYYGRKG